MSAFEKAAEFSQKIKDLAMEYDVAIVVHQVHKGGASWQYEIIPSWAAGRLDDDGEFSLRIEDGNAEQRRERMENLLRIVGSLIKLSDHTAKEMLSLMLTLESKLELQEEVLDESAT